MTIFNFKGAVSRDSVPTDGRFHRSKEWYYPSLDRFNKIRTSPMDFLSDRTSMKTALREIGG
jgi:hypothetical protein